MRNYLLFHRFDKIKKDNFNIIAAATHPNFKLSWIENEDEKRKALRLVEEECRILNDTNDTSTSDS